VGLEISVRYISLKESTSVLLIGGEAEIKGKWSV